MTLASKQQRLRFSVMDYSLDAAWHSHPLIDELRTRVKTLLPKGSYDPQDLEHQCLFRLTTFAPNDITDAIVLEVIEEQYAIVRDRLDNSTFDIEYLLRGLTGKYHDLNVNHRLELRWDGSQLAAHNEHRIFKVDFKEINDPLIVNAFTNDLHYIHTERQRGQTFGLYFSGDDLPWAIETTEPSIIVKQYKRDALLAHGIDPNKAIELTRFYTLPGAPTNAISVMDGLVGKFYKQKGIEALFTTTMPMYSKTKATTIAGGLNKPLLIKDLQHFFIPQTISGRVRYRHVTSMRTPTPDDVRTTHPLFPLMYVVEVFRELNEPSLGPLPMLAAGTRVPYIRNRKGTVECETKFHIGRIETILPLLRSHAQYESTEYIRDVIYNRPDDNRRIRYRLTDSFNGRLIELSYKYPINSGAQFKTEIEDILYHGPSDEEAEKILASQGPVTKANAYEKIRVRYQHQDAHLTLDIYPFGTWLEIEAEPDKLWTSAKFFGFDRSQSETRNADDLYLAWAREHGQPELWDVRFGLTEPRSVTSSATKS